MGEGVEKEVEREAERGWGEKEGEGDRKKEGTVT